MVVFAGGARRLTRIGAVVLIIWYISDSAKLTAEVIVTVDTDVNDSLADVQKIFANKVPSVWGPLVSISGEFAICILSSKKNTLYGLKSKFTSLSNIYKSLGATFVELYVFPTIGTPKVEYENGSPSCLWVFLAS